MTKNLIHYLKQGQKYIRDMLTWDQKSKILFNHEHSNMSFLHGNLIKNEIIENN